MTDKRIVKKKYLTKYDQSNEENLTALREMDDRLGDTPAKACLAVLHRLDAAWKAWLNPTPAQEAQQKAAREARRKKGRSTRDMFRPKFKSKRRGDWVSITVDQVYASKEPPIRRDDQGRWKLHFPKLEPMNVVYHREMIGKPKTMTLTRESTGEWFVAITCEMPDPETKKTTPIVGIDRGVTDVIADSEGRVVPGIQLLSAELKKLQRLQRVVSRRQVRGQPDSARCRKAKARVTKLHAEIRRKRDHLLHQESCHYAKTAGVVVLEDLNVAGLAKGRLARSILEQGWSRFENQLAYKLETTGGDLVHVPAAYSSQTCHACGNCDADARQGKIYRCTNPECRLYRVPQDADQNAALVIRQRSTEVLAAKVSEGPVVQTVTSGRETQKGRRKRASKSDASNSAKREDHGPSQVGIAAPSAQEGVTVGVSQQQRKEVTPSIIDRSQRAR
jgi:IS605 OrfB family transposase